MNQFWLYTPEAHWTSDLAQIGYVRATTMDGSHAR
jgi:hypothetical protein